MVSAKKKKKRQHARRKEAADRANTSNSAAQQWWRYAIGAIAIAAIAVACATVMAPPSMTTDDDAREGGGDDPPDAQEPIAAEAADAHDAARRFAAWFARHGGRLHDHLAVRHDVVGHFGFHIAATEAVAVGAGAKGAAPGTAGAKGTEMIFCPPAVLITPDPFPGAPEAVRARDAAAVGRWRARAARVDGVDWSDTQLLALRLLDERRRGRASHWAPYLAILPPVAAGSDGGGGEGGDDGRFVRGFGPRFGNTLHFAPAERKLLDGTYAASVAEAMDQYVARFHGDVAKAMRAADDDSEAPFSRAEVAWAVSAVNSRAFTVKKLRDAAHALNERPFLAPGADVFNHGAGARVGWRLGRRTATYAGGGGDDGGVGGAGVAGDGFDGPGPVNIFLQNTFFRSNALH